MAWTTWKDETADSPLEPHQRVDFSHNKSPSCESLLQQCHETNTLGTQGHWQGTGLVQFALISCGQPWANHSRSQTHRP